MLLHSGRAAQALRHVDRDARRLDRLTRTSVPAPSAAARLRRHRRGYQEHWAWVRLSDGAKGRNVGTELHMKPTRATDWADASDG
jgi:hypothetical protein